MPPDTPGEGERERERARRPVGGIFLTGAGVYDEQRGAEPHVRTRPHVNLQPAALLVCTVMYNMYSLFATVQEEGLFRGLACLLQSSTIFYAPT